MSRLIPVLLLAACTSGPPTAYRQAAAPIAPAFAPPAATPAGTGLYRPNAANTSPSAPPSPYKRVLPPTKEPGLWAGDAKASGQKVDVPLMSILLLLPEAAIPNEIETVEGCAASLEHAGGAEMDMLRRLAIMPQACAAARLYRHCADGLSREAKRERGEEYDARMFAMLKRITDAALKMEMMACTTEPTSGTTSAIRTIVERWSRTHETP